MPQWKENLDDSGTLNSGGKMCCRTLDQLYTLRRVLEGSWEFAQPVNMFVDLYGQKEAVQFGNHKGTIHLCFLQMMSRLLHQAVDLQHVQPNLKWLGWESAPLGLRSWSPGKVGGPISSGGFQVSEGLVRERGKDGAWNSQVDRCSLNNYVAIVPDHCCESTLPLSTMVMNFRDQMAGHSLRDRVRSCFSCTSRGVSRDGSANCFKCPLATSLGTCSRHAPRGRGPEEVSWLAWEELGILPDDLEEVSRQGEVWAFLPSFPQCNNGLKQTKSHNLT